MTRRERMTDAAALRRQADRLEAQAAEAEREAREAQAAFDVLSPTRQAADLLHRHFTRTYPGAGGAMDGGDPWYYESWGGTEHNRFEKMALELERRWSVDMPTLVDLLATMGDVLKGYDSEAVRVRAERSAGYQDEHRRKEAHEALDKAIDAGIELHVLRSRT